MTDTQSDPSPISVRNTPKRRPTVGDVAGHAGVSWSTASRALSGRGYVSRQALDRVQRAVETLGYVPNDIARSLKARSTKVIGMVIDDFSQGFFAEVAVGIESVLRRHGYHLLLAASDGTSENEAAALGRFEALRAEGIIVAPATPDSPAVIASLIARGMSIVEVDRRAAPGTCDAVLLENERAAYLATRHLIDLGHRRIALIAGPFTTGDGRAAGYRSALRAAGIPVDERLVSRVTFHPADPALAAGQLLDANRDTTAIVAGNNILAGGAVLAARQRNLRIPEDCSIVGFDDVPWMSFAEPALTTVAQPAREIGAQTARLLLDRMEGRLSGPPETRYLEPALIIRASTAPPSRAAGASA
jgi:LacI family transcriptional regulator